MALDNFNIETKEDSAAKLAEAAGKPTKFYLFAGEFNSIKTYLNLVKTAVNNKVDKVVGKGLSTNDFTNSLKADLQDAFSWVFDNGGAVSDHITRTDNPHSVTKTQIGLGNVDNTSDVNKPVSTAQAAADAAIATQLIDGATDNTLKKLQDKITAINAIIGGSGPDGDSIVNTVAELLAVFSSYPEGTDIVTLLGGKVATADIVNNLTQVVSGKVLDASQGKALKDLIDSLTTALSAKVSTSRTVNSKPLSSDIVLTAADIGYSQVILTSNTTAQASWNGKVVKVRGNITITIPASGLPTGYTFEFIVDPTYTLTWAIVTKTWVYGTPTTNAAKSIGTVLQDEQDDTKIYLLT